MSAVNPYTIGNFSVGMPIAVLFLVACAVYCWIRVLQSEGRGKKLLYFCVIVVLGLVPISLAGSNYILISAMFSKNATTLRAVTANTPVSSFVEEEDGDQVEVEGFTLPPFGLIRLGPEIHYYPSGAIKIEAHTLMNQFDGFYKRFYPDGNLHVTGEFMLNERHGLWTVYHRTGEIFAQGEFDHGEPINPWRYSYPGRPDMLAPYDEDLVFSSPPVEDGEAFLNVTRR